MNMVHAHASAILVCDRLVAAAALVCSAWDGRSRWFGAGWQPGEQA
jgi:hypothetical protein